MGMSGVVVLLEELPDPLPVWPEFVPRVVLVVVVEVTTRVARRGLCARAERTRVRRRRGTRAWNLPARVADRTRLALTRRFTPPTRISARTILEERSFLTLNT